jgi:hypothetical protein
MLRALMDGVTWLHPLLAKNSALYHRQARVHPVRG